MSITTDNKAFVTLLQKRLNARGENPPLKVDGWAGKLTTDAFNRHLPAPPPKMEESYVVGAPKGSENGERLYQHARLDIGLRELVGNASQARIKLAITKAASWLDPDDSKTAWCGCIMGLWCTEIGLPVPSEYYRAINWLNVGKAVQLKDAKRGDIVVLSRSGGNHVALLSEITKEGQMGLLGGNQSNSVSIAFYSTTNLKGIRRL